MIGKAVLFVFFYYFSSLVYQSVKFIGLHKHVFNHSPGPCRVLKGIAHGSEDFTLLPNGYAIISSGMRFMENMHSEAYEGRRGHIFLMDMNKPDGEPVEFSISGGIDMEMFNPLGTGVWLEEDRTYLYVVNLRVATAWVDKFEMDIQSVSLKHIKTISHDTFDYMNSLVITGEDQFYFSNYAKIPIKNSFLGKLELNLRIKLGSVGYYNNGDSRIVAQGFLIANGITLSLDKKYMYLSHVGEREVVVFKRSSDNSLEKIQEYPLYTVTDNLKTDPETGAIWTGAHPIIHKTLAYMQDPTLLSPSQVLRLKTKDGLINDVTEVYANDGTELSGSTVAQPYKGVMLVGSIASSPIVCQLVSFH